MYVCSSNDVDLTYSVTGIAIPGMFYPPPPFLLNRGLGGTFIYKGKTNKKRKKKRKKCMDVGYKNLDVPRLSQRTSYLETAQTGSYG